MKKILLLVILLTVTAMAGKNPYTKQGTDEYESITRRIHGEWLAGKLEGFYDDDEKIGDRFSEVVIEFKDAPKKNDDGEYLVKLKLNDELVKDRVSHYGDNDKDRAGVKVDEYWIVGEGEWTITNKGLILLKEIEVFVPELIGSGENLSGFIAKETSLLGITTSESSSYGGIGSIGNIIAAKTVQSSSGLDKIVPELERILGKITIEKGVITITDEDDDDDVNIVLNKKSSKK